MHNNLKQILGCPSCHNALIISEKKMKCSNCGKQYNIVNDKPVFLNKRLSSDEISVGGFRDKLRKNKAFFRIFKKVHSIFGPPDTTSSKRVKFNGAIVDYPLYNMMKSFGTKRILNVGSSSVQTNYKNSINLDIDLFDNVDVVADGKNLPFKDKSFDFVIIEMVLEHVDESEKVIAESYRVLKNGGKVFISIPFMHVFHGSPNDFNRYTLNGLSRRLELQGFSLEKEGVLSGPSAAFSQILRYYLAILFSFNNDFLFSLFLNIFGWLTFPIKYLDILVAKHKKAHLIANTIYAIGRK